MTTKTASKNHLKFKLIPILIFFMVLMLSLRLKGLFVSFSNPEDNSLITQTSAIASDISPKKTNESNFPLGKEFSSGYLLTEETISGIENLSKSELDVLQNLAKRREEIDAREKQLEQQLALLKAAESQIERKISSLKSYEKSIKELLGIYDKKEQERLSSLVDLYTKMKPKDAAIIFDDLEMNILISLFEKMRTQNAAAILSAMSPEKARALTIELAERNRLNTIKTETDKTILR